MLANAPTPALEKRTKSAITALEKRTKRRIFALEKRIYYVGKENWRGDWRHLRQQ